MKKLLMIVMVIAISSLMAFGQWQVVKQETINEIAPDDGFFIDANTGWLIGDYANDGAVWKTTDGGENWTVVRPADESGPQWRNIEFFDADTGYACAGDGYIFKTVDGGANWTMVGDTANYKADLRDVAVVSADVVYFSGMDWTVLKTTDGGGSYVAQGDSATFLGDDLDGGIDFTDADNGVVLADGPGGLTWYTHDGGTNWNFVSVGPLFPPGLSSSRIYDVAINGTTVVIGAYHYCIFISTDGGETYTRSGDYTFDGRRFHSISLIDANTIYIGGTHGHVVKSIDGGANWETLPIGTGQNLEFLHFVDADNGYVISGGDQWFKTADGGANFTTLFDWPGINFWGLALTADDKIIVTAEDGGEMTVSEDGGITWSYPNNCAIGALDNIYACEFADANNGMVAGSGTLKKTVDGGATWTKLANPIEDLGSSIYSINYENVDTVFIGGSSGKIFYSYDGGATWMGDDYGSGSIYGIWKISDTQIIAAVGDGKIYNSSVIGDSISFAQVEDYGTMHMEAVEFRGDVGIVVAKKGHIYRTTVAEWDTLVEVFTDPAGDDFYDVEFIDDNLVFVVGEAGKIYKSEDAGLTWILDLCTNTEELHKVRFRNNKLWAVGDAATILLLDLTPIPITIAEAKVDADANFVPDLLDQSVLIQGIITTPNYDSKTSYYLQDATAGINLYTYSFASALNIGDEVLITGVIAQYKGLTEITPASETDITVLSTGNNFDTTLVTIPDFGESIECQLVQLNNVWLVEGSTWPSEGSYASLEITDGVDTLILRIDDDTDLDGWANSPTGTFNVIGVVGQYTSSDPANDGYQIMPRFQTDIFSVTVTIAVMIPGDGSYRSFWVNGSWDNNGAYDSDWSGDMVELTDADGDNIFVGTVDLMIDNTNTYGWWLGAENSTSTYVKGGADFQVLSTDPVFTDTLEIPSPWIITMPGTLNSWDPSDQNLTRTETVWASDSIFIAASTTVEYKYAVGLSWKDDNNPFQAYAAEGYNAGENITFTSDTDALYVFAFDDANDSCYVTLVKEVGIDDVVALPKVFKVYQNYPNPFNPTTTMKFDLPKETHVTICIYNMLGKNIRTLADNKLFNAGYHQVIWNGVNNNGDQLSSGIYFYQVRTENNLKTNRMLLLK